MHCFYMDIKDGAIMEKVKLRGVNFTAGSLAEIAEYILSRIKNGETTAVFTPNSEIVQLCIDDPSLYEVINSAEVIIPDGIGVIKAAKVLKLPITERVPGIEMGEHIISVADETMPVFFMGGKPGVAETAAEKLKEKYPALTVCGTHDGYFKKTGEENEAVIDEINNSGAKILFVCLGAPAQEKWIYENPEKLQGIQLMMGLGGSLDVFSGNVERAPEFFCKMGLEWFYRLIKEPWRIGRMMNLPKFYFGTVWYKLKGGK